jgi:hypothetical protein
MPAFLFLQFFGLCNQLRQRHAKGFGIRAGEVQSRRNDVFLHLPWMRLSCSSHLGQPGKRDALFLTVFLDDFAECSGHLAVDAHGRNYSDRAARWRIVLKYLNV